MTLLISSTQNLILPPLCPPLSYRFALMLLIDILGADFCQFAGHYDVSYTGGTTDTLFINNDGSVSGLSPAVAAQLTASSDARCPGQPCALLEGYGSGKYELITVDSAGAMTTKYFDDSDATVVLDGTAQGMLRSDCTAPGNPLLNLPLCTSTLS